jgi:hypothetical protein
MGFGFWREREGQLGGSEEMRIWGSRVSSICVIEIENCNGDYIFIPTTMKPKGHGDSSPKAEG